MEYRTASGSDRDADLTPSFDRGFIEGKVVASGRYRSLRILTVSRFSPAPNRSSGSLPGDNSMKHLIKIIAAANRTVCSLRPAMLLFILLLLTGWVNAQSKNDLPASKELYDRIASLDAALFDAYNACDIDKVGTFFTDDLEFYHEKGGLTLERKTTLELMRTNLCGRE